MSAGKQDHRRFWEPSMDEFWTSKSDGSSISGFPCFCVLYLRAVSKGQEGDEASQDLEDLVYIYPHTIPEHIQISYVGVLSSFGTWSRLNLGNILSSLTWNESEIAVSAAELTDGNFLLYALKMPSFYTYRSVSSVLEMTLTAYRLLNENMNSKFSSEAIPRVRDFFALSELVMKRFTFNKRHWMENCWYYATRPLKCLEQRSPMAIATGLFTLVSEISPRVMGSAMFVNNNLILSSLSHRLTSYWSLLKTMALRDANHQPGRFDSLKLWLPRGIFEGIDKITPVNISIAVWNKVSFLVCITGHEPAEKVLLEISNLLDNDMGDFAEDCGRALSKGSEPTPGIVAFWPDTGIAKGDIGQMSWRTLGQMQDQFNESRKMQEIITSDGRTQATAVRVLDVEVFVEAEAQKGRLSTQIPYEKMQSFMPYLPEEFKKL